MKIKSGLITQMSGSVGGLTGSHNQGGLYFRARTVPVNPQSSFQVSVRNALTQLTSRWADVLTQAQRDAWAVYNQNVTIIDRLGEPRQIGAIAHYIRSNTPRLQAGLAIVDDAPTTFDLGSFDEPGPQPQEIPTPETSLAFNDTEAWVNTDGSALLVYQSAPQSPTINFFKGPYRFAGSVLGNSTTPETSPVIIPPSQPFVAGQKLFYQYRLTQADGRLSSVIRNSAVAV